MATLRVMHLSASDIEVSGETVVDEKVRLVASLFHSLLLEELD